MHINKQYPTFSELWYLHLKEQQVPLRHFRLGLWGITMCGLPPWLQRHSNQRGGGSETQKASSRLHEGCLSSGFRCLLSYNLTCGIADQSSTRSIWYSIIYTSVKPTVEKKAMKARFTEVELRPETKVRWAREKAPCYLQLIILVFTTA